MAEVAWEPYAEDYRRGELIEPHSHDLAQIVFAKSGVMRVHTEQGAWVVPPQRALWMPAGVVHWISCRTAVAMRTVYLDPAAVPAGGGETSVLAATPLLREIILRLVEGEPCATAALIAVLVGELAAVPVAPLHLPEPRDPRLRRVCAAMRAAPGDPAGLAEHARAAGASSPHADAPVPGRDRPDRFRAWQRQLRLLVGAGAAGRLGQPVTTIALDLGYASPSAFIAAFRAGARRDPSALLQLMPEEVLPRGSRRSTSRAQ